MMRRSLLLPDTLSLLLVWTPVVGVAIGAGLGWSSVAILSLAALCAAVSMWALVRAVVLRRAERQVGLDQAVREVRGAVTGRDEPEDVDPEVMDSTERASRALARLSPLIRRRLGDVAREADNLRAILNASQSPIVVTNAIGDVILANRAAENFFERSMAQLIGRPIEELFTQAEVLGQHAASLKGQLRVGQVRLQRADGIRVFQIHTAPVSLAIGVAPVPAGRVAPAARGLASTATGTENGVRGTPPGAASEEAALPETGVFVSLRDVTELATAVQLKTDFVANASHELRTPLASIRAAVETLADGAWDDHPMRTRLAQMISTNVDRLEEMVRDLLDLSRLEGPDVQPQLATVRVSELEAALDDIFETACRERGLKLEFEFEPGLDRLFTDGKLLLLILKNLVDNSTKFAYAGSAIRVTGELVEVEPGRRGRAGARFAVEDKGMGIPIGLQPRVFERFYQVDQARTGSSQKRGSGLGLAIVKHAVKVLGGTLTLESVWKQGTTIRVELPGCVEREGERVKSAE
jgi:PAS domain S-box-containing protein